MSTPGPPLPPGEVHPLRQQIDELDALIQRMMALPVNQAEEGLSPSPETVAVAPVPVALPARTHPGPLDSGPGAPEATGFPPPSPSQERRHSSPEGTRGDGPSPSLPQKTHTKSQGRSSLAASPSLESETFSDLNLGLPAAVRSNDPGGEGLGGLFRPLLWCNLAFDGCAARLGPPGRWLQGTLGRALLGWTGLGLLTAALVWAVLDWIGWTW